jgi:PEGA domain
MKPLNYLTLSFCLAVLLLTSGCISRSLMVESEPAGGEVYFNGHKKGVTPVEFNFKWYGKHKVTVEKEGYQPASKIVELRAPLHHKMPLDLVTSALPVKSTDNHQVKFELEAVPPTVKTVE